LKLEGGRRRVADLLDFARRARRRSLGRPAVGSRHHLPAACDGEPGDLFSTGAPGGVAVGQANAAELYLKPGDTNEIAYEGIATLRTHIVAP
ncbi:MAG: fumarylacetoacetate hydrolase family protein, partial [Burkholderiales bacterium]